MSGFVMLSWIDLKLSLRNVVATFFTFAFPVLMILLFGAMYGNAPNALYGGFGAMDVAVPGYAATLVIGSAAFMGLPIELASRRQSGVLRRFRASPLSAASILGSQLLVSLAVSALGTAVLLVAASVAWRVRLPAHPLLLLPAFLLCAASQFALGLVIASLVRTVKAALAVSMALFYPMLFLSGGTIPTEFLPMTLKRVSAILPMSFSVRLLRGLWLGQGWDLAASLSLLGVMVAGAVVSALLLRWD
jgi:ABC-2 type transport system permease protein